MPLRFECRTLFFSLVLLLMGCTNGVRNVAKRDQSYIAGYGTVDGEEGEVADDYKNNQPYLIGYRGDIKETNKPYVIRYGGAKETNEHLYITSYENAKKLIEHPYITGYGKAKEMNEEEQTKEHPYITSYGKAKEGNKHPYITGYGKAKETNEEEEIKEHPYITVYGKVKEKNEHPYITGYGKAKETKEEEQTKEHPYITVYGKAKKKNEHPYITGYGKAKETNEEEQTKEHPYITVFGKAEEKNEHPYITGYGKAKETNEEKETKEHLYITSYGKASEMNIHPYITRNWNNEETSRSTYITGYRNSEEATETPSQDATSKCKKHLHAHSLSRNEGHRHIGHGNHMHTQSSNSKNRTEAFKLGFFTPIDLYAEKIMALHFPIQDHSRFLPKDIAESIPFSTSQLPNLLQLFSIVQGSPEAKDMEETLRDCGVKPINGEIKLCATSLESMVEFVRSILGLGVNLSVISTTHPTMTTALTQNYTVLEVPKEVLAPKMVSCHPVPYPYAVFFCHYFGTETKVFQVSLGGNSGDNVEAVAVCHMDTSDWDSDHILFQLLGVKPGTSSPVCHFLPANHLVWVPSPTIATE